MKNLTSNQTHLTELTELDRDTCIYLVVLPNLLWLKILFTEPQPIIYFTACLVKLHYPCQKV